MKINYLPTIILLFILLSSCVPKEKYEKLKEEKIALEKTRDSLSFWLRISEKQNRRYIKELSNIKKKKKKTIKKATKYSNDDALKHLNDYYKFYRRDYTFKEPKVRRKSNNEFVISLKEVDNEFKNVEQFYSSRVCLLTINNDGTYILDLHYQ
ncbi:hypothetical protein ABHQ57_06845 [Tenacibaculum sp. ZH5_bin.1]|uniref:hypothetical protein n=1 Tax=Tenacibaculum TaxID=104267 RepID=UPI0012E4B521|nr:hypothetical protein [Tenacibaculum maritimum]CAA0236434.1 hypothetical protein USCSE301_540006 [Tenacibaculum maritimum]